MRIGGGYGENYLRIWSDKWVLGTVAGMEPRRPDGINGVVDLDEQLTAEGVVLEDLLPSAPRRKETGAGTTLVMTLRHVGAGWGDTSTVHLELRCSGWPTAGLRLWIESHTTYIRIGSPSDRGTAG